MTTPSPMTMPAPPDPMAMLALVESERHRRRQGRREELERVERERDTRSARKSLAAFVRAAWPMIQPSTPLVWGWHLDAKCEHLEAVTRGQIRNLLITEPPGCTKTLILCVFWQAWEWIEQPHTCWLTGANEIDLATDASVKCRRLIESDWYRACFGSAFALMKDQNQKTWFDNDKGGKRQCTSVGSVVTGKKADRLVLDDPNDAKKVQGEADRRGVIEWIRDAWYDRLNHPKTGARVASAQRTHVGDAINYLKGTGAFDQLCIPEEWEEKRRFVTSIGWTDPRKAEGE
jgi:hypothetical protein